MERNQNYLKITSESVFRLRDELNQITDLEFHKNQPTQAPPDPEALFTQPQAAAFLGFRERTLQDWRQKGGGPAFIRISTRSVRYRRKDLITWGDERVKTSTAAA